MLKNLQKLLSKHALIIAVGVVVLYLVVNNYSAHKGSHSEGNTAASSGGAAATVAQVVPAHPAGENEVSASVDGITTSSLGLPPSCSKGTPAQPGDLLPKTGDNAWGQLMPNSGNGDLANVNLLDAGFHNGIDTVMGSLRNANLQVRSEPPNPQTKVSPWQNTTIEPDLMRVPLELGCGPQ
tara:strand:- start:6420 stop:6962 length:543 start_codon:yes stop_codon:yes gene_type:complete